MLFLHLSDIHFRAKDINRQDDPNAGLRDDLVADVKFMRERLGRTADAILISGDIAFSGERSEYDFAYLWLQSVVCPAAGCSIEDVFVIPGNHDVDRNQAATPMHCDARHALRGYPATKVDDRIRQYLSDKSSAQLLFAPLENYNRFAARFLCSIGAYDQARPEVRPFVKRDWPMDDGSVLRTWGFNSVLVSDDTDDRDQMLIDPAGAQIQREDGVAHVVVCHHPYAWLKNGAGFRERIEAVSQVHLFGHEHTRRVEEGVHFTTVRAGAVQPDRDEPGWGPGYNWINLQVGRHESGRCLDVEIWVRKREGARFIAVPDREQSDPWKVRHRLPDWTPPVQSAEPSPASAVTMTKETGPQAEQGAVSSRSVASKLFRLTEHVQRQIIVALGLDQDGDQGLKDYEFVLAAVKRAKDRGQLSELNDKADQALGSISAR